MKRFISILLCLLLLTGCNQLSGEPSPTQTTPTTEPSFTLMEQAQALGEAGNLYYIPNVHIEAMACPEIRLYGNGLLAYEQGMDGQLLLKRISLADGKLLAEATYPMGSAALVQIGSGLVAVCDAGAGQVLLLNEALEPEKTYDVPVQDAFWQLGQELENLYLFYPEKGLQCRNLATGESRWLVENAAFVQLVGSGSGYALFSYTDRDDKKTYVRCLNLSTATLETLPVDGGFQSALRSGQQWLLRRDVMAGDYLLADEGQISAFTWPDGAVSLLPNRGQLLAIDGDYRNMTLYDLQGKCLSRCALPQQEYATVGADFVWSGYWEGYFFRDTYDNAAHLMFWDTGVSQKGEDLSLLPQGTAQAPEPVLEQALYDQAKAIGERYGMEILIAEQCALEYNMYEADIFQDPYFVRDALNTLERALSAYPEGFLQQLPFGSMDKLRIELTMHVRTKEEVDTRPPEAGGFASMQADHYLVVLDGEFLEERTVYHELSHVIDAHLAWDAQLRPEALFSEETWLSYQPEGFRYAESYIDYPEDVLAFEFSDYFVRRYAMTFPTEDRATLMERAILLPQLMEKSPPMVAKMKYYAACIRDCFDTELWPEETAWE